MNGKDDKRRNSGIELLRIVLMIMILILHFCEKPGFNAVDYFDLKIKYTCWILEAFCIVAVNCFVLITGYFLVKSECKIKKVINLWGQILFYTLIIWLIFKVFLKDKVTLVSTLGSFFPIILKTYWFVSIYVVLYLLAPYLNKCIQNINEKELKRLIFILVAISNISSFLISFGFPVIDDSNGYGILWFVTLYLIGAYIRLYYKPNKRKTYMVKYVFISILILISKFIFIKLIKNGILERDINIGALYKYNSITVLLSSVCLFLFFKDLKIKNKKIENAILKISPLIFTTYIIHENPLIRGILYNEILHTQNIYYLKKFLIVMLIYCISMLVVCCIIELFRIKIFKITGKIKDKVLSKYKEKIL